MKHIEPLEAYHAALTRAGNVRDKEILAAKIAYNTAADKAWEKYKAIMEIR